MRHHQSSVTGRLGEWVSVRGEVQARSCGEHLRKHVVAGNGKSGSA